MRGNLYELQKLLDEFVAERGWQRYHRPKNLAMSVAIEAAELMEHFQWCDKDPKDIDEQSKAEIAEEMADVVARVAASGGVSRSERSAAGFWQASRPMRSKFHGAG